MTAQINFCRVAHHNDIIYVYRQNISTYSDLHQHDTIQHLH